MLKFIGTGSAFNTMLGNNSAYFKVNNTMYLIDCGGTIFDRIVNARLLDGVNKLVVAITHTHPDHIGSLGDLIFYAHYIKKINPMLIFPDTKKLASILKAMGVTKEHYQLLTPSLDDQQNNVRFLPFTVDHVKELTCYGYIINIEGNIISYSGDSNMLSRTTKLMLQMGSIKALYQDTCGLDYDGNVHLSYSKLAEQITEPYLRKKVWCMHLDKSFDVEKALADGFNVVEEQL